MSQAALQLALVVLWATGRGVVSRTTVASAILLVITTCGLSALSSLEHSRSIRPSVILQLFYLFTTILDLPRVRTQWLLEDNTLVAAMVTTTFALRLPLLWLESVQKWHHSTLPADQIPPEERQGIFGRTFFWWLNPLFLEGYSRDLSMDDLYSIDDGLKGTILYERLFRSWKTGKHIPSSLSTLGSS